MKRPYENATYFLKPQKKSRGSFENKRNISQYVVDQKMPFLESLENINNERSDEQGDPTYVPCERVFGVLTYAEKALPYLQFDSLA